MMEQKFIPLQCIRRAGQVVVAAIRPPPQTLRPRRHLSVASHSSYQSIARHNLSFRSHHAFAIRPLTSHVSERYYATGRNQHQMYQTFAAPFGEFVSIIGRFFRILIFAGVGFSIIYGGVYVGSHIYVEKLGIKGDMYSKKDRDKSLKDVWGWSSQFQEEELWGPVSGGSDPRLSFWARFGLRCAWMATHWGIGVPSSVLRTTDAPSGTVFGTRSGPSPELVALAFEKVDGLADAEQYLDASLKIAEEEGIALPDIAALRAGLKDAHQSGADVPLDQTALVLETRLAACRERISTPETLLLAIAGYERIYDALTAVSATQEAVNDPGQPAVTSSRLVRLATKLGHLNAEIGRKEEAEAWLLKAIDLAGQESQVPDCNIIISGDIASAIEADASASSTSLSGWFTGWGREPHKSLPPRTLESSPPSSNAVPRTAATPTPALTRSLVSTLLSISGLYASSPTPDVTDPRDAKWRAKLEQALRIQSAALRLIRLELSRVETQAKTTPDSSSQSGRDLHSLWLKHNEAMVNLHLAETIYALNRSGSRVADAVRPAASEAAGTDEGHYAQSIEWLLEADSTAQSVQASLLKPEYQSGKADAAGKEVENVSDTLKPQWTKQVQLRIPAEILLRDAGRVRSEAKAMVEALDNMSSGAGGRSK